jgi:ABC-type lipoprotein export system ATPase subunit
MADEPTGNLDSRTSREIIGLLRLLNEQTRITIILVTHDQDIARHAHRILVLKDGQIVVDTPDSQRAIQALHAPD